MDTGGTRSQGGNTIKAHCRELLAHSRFGEEVDSTMAKAKSAERTESLRMKTKRARKAKKPKKEGPKRSTSAYFYFMADKRAAVSSSESATLSKC